MIKRDPACTLCKLHKTAQYVCLLGQGPKQCDVMVIGEAPGKREDDSGKPFVGKSGGVLEEALEEHGFHRDDIFITNAVSCRPPDNRTPTKAEIRSCKVWLDRQIQSVKPKYVLLLGNVPLYAITGEVGIKSKRGRPFEKDGIIFLPTFHPAFILRDDTQQGKFNRDIALFSEIVERGSIPQEDKLNFEVISDIQTFKRFLKDLSGTVSFDIEATSDDPELGGLYPWAKNYKITSIGWGTKRKQWILQPQNWPRDAFETMLLEVEERMRECIVVMHNGKFDCLCMWVVYGVQWHHFLDFDTMLAHYASDENDNHGLKYLAQKFCGAPDWEVDLDTKMGRGSSAKQALYHAHDLYYTRELRFIIGKMLHQDGDSERIFKHILMPCARMFTEIEYDGVCIDTTKLDEAHTYLTKEVKDAEREMRKYGDIENWGSPQQLANLLFGKLGLDIVEKTKTGKASTSESVIKRIDHPIAGAILKFRGAKQQLSFFIDGWKPYFHRRRNGIFLHPSFKLHGTVTGRLSCEHPNLQQVPRDVRIRQLIKAMPGWTLVEADLSQIELRVAAELAQERTMLEAFSKGIDVHWLTATGELSRGGGGKHTETIIRTAEAFLKRQKKHRKLRFAEAMEIVINEVSPGLAEELQKEWGETNPEMLWKEIRKKAKAVNFGYLYGMWWKKFKLYARDNYGVILDDDQAQDSREFFFDMFSDFPEWHKKQKRYARRNGYVKSLSGRKRRLPRALDSVDSPERREAERQAINSPVQSFANEINLMAALQLREEFGRDIVRICGTVHDSILVYVKNGHVAKVTRRLLQIMKRPKLFDLFDIKLGVPVLAEAKVGSWGTGIAFEKWEQQEAA